MDAPQISAATAGATGNQAGIGVSDRLVVTFDSATNRAGFGTGTMTKANVDALFSFTSGGNVVSLGTSCVPSGASTVAWARVGVRAADVAVVPGAGTLAPGSRTLSCASRSSTSQGRHHRG